MRLLPGVRLVERPDALHFFDGRRVVSLRGGEAGHRAVLDELRDAVTESSSSATGAPPAGDAPRSGEPRGQVRDLLTRLQVGGPAADSDTPEVGALFASAAVGGQISARQAARRLTETTVLVWGDEEDALLTTLSLSGVRTRRLDDLEDLADLDRAGPRHTLLVAQADEQRPLDRLRAANRACLAHGVPWLHVGRFDGAVIRVGPLMLPGQTACAECLLRRLAANVAYTDLYEFVAGAPAAPASVAVTRWAHAIAALVVLHWIASADPDLPGRLLTLDPQALSARSARVFRVPRCPVCSAADYIAAPAPWSVGRDH